MIDSITKTCPCNKQDFFSIVKFEHFIRKKGIFLIFAQNIDCWYTIEPPHRGSSNEYPQFMFKSKNKTSSPRATIAYLRVNKYSHWTNNWVFYHIWVWWPSWSCDLETLLTSAEELLSRLCILFSAILVNLKKSFNKARVL